MSDTNVPILNYVINAGIGPDLQFWNPKFSTKEFPILKYDLIDLRHLQACQKELSSAKELIGKLKDAVVKYDRSIPDEVHFEDCITTLDDDENCDCGVALAENNLCDILKQIEQWESGK